MTNLQDIATKKPHNIFKGRRAARILAVQCMYNISVTNEETKSSSDIIQDILSYGLETDPNLDQQYFLDLMNGCYSNITTIHQTIQKYLSEKWKIGRLAEVVQSILSVSTYELLYNQEANPSIIINEYIEIAKIFNHDGEAGFINSILDKVSKQNIPKC